MPIRYHWLVDCNPGPRTDVQGRDVVCVPSKAARPTKELGLGFTVGLLDVPTGWTFMTGVPGVNKEHRDTSEPGFVHNKGSELVEGPICQSCVMPLPNRYPIANALEIFKANSATGALSVRHNGFTDPVVFVLLITGLFAAKLLQFPSSRAGTLPLKISSSVGGLPPVFLDVLSRVDVAITVGRDVDDSEVNSEHFLWSEEWGLIYFANSRQVKGSLHEEEINLPLSMGKKFPLSFPTGKWDYLPAINSPDRDFVVCLEAQDSVVEGESPKQAKASSGPAIEFVSIRNLRDAANHNLGGKPRTCSNVVVDQLVQSVLTEDPLLPGGRTDLVTDGVGLFKGTPQSPTLLFGWGELEIDDESHSSNLTSNGQFVKNGKEDGHSSVA